MFDLMMIVLADNAANAPYESVRLGAEDLMEKRMRFSQLYPGAGGDPYASVRMYEKEAAKLIQGGGGGQPHFATAGGKNVDGLNAAVEKVLELAGI